jgi:hypothetical protein
MKGLRRTLIDTAAWVSLALLAATLFLWVRGFWLDEHLRAYPDTAHRLHTVVLWTYRNGFCLADMQAESTPENVAGYAQERSHTPRWTSRPGGGAGWERGFSPVNVRWKVAGFAWLRSPSGNPWRPWRSFAFPAWFPALAFGVLPTLAVVRRLRRRCHPAGCCQHCGYDLRATPDRCPECGRAANRA